MENEDLIGEHLPFFNKTKKAREKVFANRIRIDNDYDNRIWNDPRLTNLITFETFFKILINILIH